MKFTSVIKTGKRCVSGKQSKNEVAYSVNKCGKANLAAVFYIGTNIMKKAKLLVGDYVDVLQSEDKTLGMIRRVTDGGRKLSPTGGNGKSSCRVAFVKTKMLPMVEKRTVCDNVVIEDDGILFAWPK